MILDAYRKINDFCSQHNTKLIAVSKTKPKEDISFLYNLGQRSFGENKVQELLEKYEQLPKDIEWHFIGHLQKNKVKYIAEFVHLIHAVDSISLLKEINKRAKQNERKINCLIQFHIADEESKFGLNISNYKSFFEEALTFENVNIIGVMGMATFTENQAQISREFKSLKTVFEKIKQEYFIDNKSFKEISMGMSGDYKLAIKEGSTMVRVGSSIFGSR